MKPLIFYVDDEPHNLTIFETALSGDWEILTFDNPMKALKEMNDKSPWVIVSDQRMAHTSGVEFLELTMKIHPNAVRIIVTGYSDENLVVESVRRAKVFDYIRKPWDHQDLENSLSRAIEFYKANVERIRLEAELKKHEEELKKRNTELLQMTIDLDKSHNNEKLLRKELECWAPPFILKAIDQQNNFPVHRDLVCITFDLINSSSIHDVYIESKPIRKEVIRIFSELIIKYGGWRESHSGDSAFGHFGLIENNKNSFDLALAVAREFRVALRNLCAVNKIEIECGIALHKARNCVVDIHTVQLNTPDGVIVQKSFDATSKDIDLLHRIEKLAHSLPGTNILMTESFYDGLNKKTDDLKKIGAFNFKGSEAPTSLYLIASDKTTDSDIQKLALRDQAAA